MHITKWDNPEVTGVLVRVTTQEAIRLIRSLAHQIEKNDPEYGRAEFYTKDGEYFSVAVADDKDPYDICGDCGNWATNDKCDLTEPRTISNISQDGEFDYHITPAKKENRNET